jgi:hypothetical protein
MPPEALAALLGKIDDPNEPEAAALTISRIAENKTAGSKLSGELVVRALDKGTHVSVRVAAIYAIGSLKLVSIMPELDPLIHDANDKIAGAVADIGVRR